MKEKTLEALIASPPERDDLVVQLFVKGQGQWGEMIYLKGKLILELFPREDGEPWQLDLDEVQYVIQKGKEELNLRLG
jgi:hypothetical protein